MSAIWTSGEPVSPSLVAYSAKICFLTSASSGTWLLRHSKGGVPVDGHLRVQHIPAGLLPAAFHSTTRADSPDPLFLLRGTTPCTPRMGAPRPHSSRGDDPLNPPIQ